jgi:hypothetical protein
MSRSGQMCQCSMRAYVCVRCDLGSRCDAGSGHARVRAGKDHRRLGSQRFAETVYVQDTNPPQSRLSSTPSSLLPRDLYHTSLTTSPANPVLVMTGLSTRDNRQAQSGPGGRGREGGRGGRGRGGARERGTGSAVDTLGVDLLPAHFFIMALGRVCLGAWPYRYPVAWPYRYLSQYLPQSNDASSPSFFPVPPFLSS